MPPRGRHCILELHDCPRTTLDDVELVLGALRAAAAAAGSTLLAESHHRFEPCGLTAIGLLAESHVAIHTWPELGYAAADVFTCGEHTDPEAACRHLIAALGAARHQLEILHRGEVPPGARRPPAPAAEP